MTMWRWKETSFGQRGGMGPNTGKKAATFAYTRPDGVVGRTRVFKNAPEGEDAFVVLYPPHNGHDWLVGQVKAARGDFDDLMRDAARDRARWPQPSGPMPVVVPCRRVQPGKAAKRRQGEPWRVTSFGQDCLGNITGYAVVQGVGLTRVTAPEGVFCGNIYEVGSFDLAWTKANALMARLNAGAA
jgi:hypothetical protein